MSSRSVMGLTVAGAGLYLLVAHAANAANLTPNPGFESVCGSAPCNWSPTLGTTVTSSTTAHSGSFSMSVSESVSGGGAASDCISPLPAGTYSFSFWYNTTSTNIAALQGGLNFFAVPNCGGGGGNTALFASPLNTTGTWTQVSGMISAPAGTQSVWAEVFFQCGGTIGTTPCTPASTALFDDVFFGTSASTPEPSTWIPTGVVLSFGVVQLCRRLRR